MEDFFNNKLVWLVAFVTVFNVGVYLSFSVLINKTTNAVIEKLQKEYSPSPYGPGFDPDRVNPDAFRRQEVLFREGQGIHLAHEVMGTETWKNHWERNRATP